MNKSYSLDRGEVFSPTPAQSAKTTFNMQLFRRFKLFILMTHETAAAQQITDTLMSSDEGQCT